MRTARVFRSFLKEPAELILRLTRRCSDIQSALQAHPVRNSSSMAALAAVTLESFSYQIIVVLSDFGERYLTSILLDHSRIRQRRFRLRGLRHDVCSITRCSKARRNHNLR